MKVSNETLEEIIHGDVRHSALLVEMAKELLAHRKAWSEPVAYTDKRNLRYLSLGGETALVWAKNNIENGDIELFRKPDTGEV